MNHVTPNYFIELPFRVDLKLKGRLLPSVTLKKLLLHCFTNFTFTPWIVSVEIEILGF